MKNLKKIPDLLNPMYQETKQHTDMMFAYNVYPCTIPDDFPFVPIHWHNSAEIIYIKQGSGTVQVDFDTYTAQSGDIFFILPGHLHGLKGIHEKRMEYENIIFDMDFLGNGKVDLCSQKYLRPMMNGQINFPPRIQKGDRMYFCISACLNASDQLCSLRPAGYELGVKGHLMVLFSILIQLTEPVEKNTSDKNIQKLKAVLLRIESDYDKKLTVNDIASECGYSSSHFMRWFKNITGSGFITYLIDYRLSKAALALRNTDDTILGISEKTGFDNLSNFNRLFKKKFKMTPSQFRRKALS